jgi:hypothetical protein
MIVSAIRKLKAEIAVECAVVVLPDSEYPPEFVDNTFVGITPHRTPSQRMTERDGFCCERISCRREKGIHEFFLRAGSPQFRGHLARECRMAA